VFLFFFWSTCTPVSLEIMFYSMPYFVGWNLTEVKEWIIHLYDDVSVADKFCEQEVDGRTLFSDQILTEESLTMLGLNTIGKKARFKTAVEELKGNDYLRPCSD